MEELYAYRRKLLERYVAVGGELAARLGQITAEEPTSSLSRVVAHLLEVEERVFLPVMQRILHEEEPLLHYPQVPLDAREELRGEATLSELLEAYALLREKAVRLLEQQPAENWGRGGRHPVFGLRTLQWWVEQDLKHIEEHLKEVPC